MGKNQSASGLTNIIQYDNSGNISFVSGSTTLMSVSSSGAITTTGVISGSSVQSASLAQNSNLLQGTGSVGFATTGSLLTVSSSQQQISSSLLQVSASYISLSGSYNTFSGSASTRITTISSSQQDISSSQQQISASLLNVIAVYATTGSNSFRATQSITGSLTVTGQIIAQTINVQQVTSSIVYSSGSNVFGCDLNSRQTFTGSVLMTGSLIVNTTGPELQVNNNGVILGNLTTDRHGVTGSFYQTGSVAVFNSCIGIGLNNPTNRLEVQSGDIKLNAGGTRCTSVFFGITGTNYGRIQYSDMDGSMLITTMGAGSGYDLNLGTKCITRLTISGDGNVGIGTCSPNSILQIGAGGNLCSPRTTIEYSPAGFSTANAPSAPNSYSNGDKLIFWNDATGKAAIGVGDGYNLLIQATGASNSAIQFFTSATSGNAGSERMRITSAGIACFACQVCVPNIISTDATNTTLRISCAIVPLSNYRTSDCGYGGIDFFNNGKGYACSAKFYTFKTSTEFYGLTNDYNGSAQLSLIACGAGGAEDIAFFTGTSATPKVVIDNNATCITCQLSVGPSVTIGSQGGTDTTVIGGGSGVGSLIRMNYAGGSYNNYLAGNGDNYFNCLLGKLNAAGGVKFGSGATTLNNYEEGTWTPRASFGGWTSNANVSNAGWYTRIGNLVTAGGTLDWSGGSGTQSGAALITGLPFAASSTSNTRNVGQIGAPAAGSIGFKCSGKGQMVIVSDPGQSTMYLIETFQDGTYTTYIHTPCLANAGTIYGFQLTYHI